MEPSIGIVAQRENDRAQALAATILGAVGEDVRCVVDEETGRAIDSEGVPVAAMADCDLVVSIGGDGTFLFVAREAGGAPILGVNLGEVGFLNAVAPDEAVETVVSLVEKRRRGGTIDGRTVDRLRAEGEGWELAPAVNEVVVHGHHRGHGGGAGIAIAVDGEPYAESHADGVLVSTPTGSTAYNLSEGGPLVRPTVDALVVTQMCAQEPMPPLVTDADSEIELRLTSPEGGYAISDGRNRRRLDSHATVRIAVADEPIVLAGPRGDFFEALEKLE